MQENRNPIKDMAKSFIKAKVLAILAPVLIGFFLLLLIAGIIIIIIYPVVKGGQLNAGVPGFWERLVNSVTLKCFFCDDQELKDKEEAKFYEKIDKLDEAYQKGKGMDGTSIQLDIPLLLSAVFYTENPEEMFIENSSVENMENITEGDIFGNLGWYEAKGDPVKINWFQGATEAEGCYITGFEYSNANPPSTASKLRQLAKHMVKKTMTGTCRATHDEEGNFTGWSISERTSYSLDIDQEDKLYTMEFDQNPYMKKRTKDEADNLPPTFLTYLLSTYLPENFGKILPKAVYDLSDDHKLYLNKRKNMKNTIYSYRVGYEYLVGSSGNGAYCAPTNGNCTYEITDKDGQKQKVSNLKVQLLQCGANRGEIIAGEELVDFEKYITGVVYAEIGGQYLEASKAQAIAARSYALTRGKQMGTGYLQIYQKNGQWILPIRNCTEDQAYCDPDKGCTVRGSGESTIFSGDKTSSIGGTYKPPIPLDSTIRKAAEETAGQVLVDVDGSIHYTPYTAGNGQNLWLSVAAKGGDAYEALIARYKDTSLKLSSSCSGTSGTTRNTGDFVIYNQGKYSNVPYCSGGATLKSAGCLPTAFAMVVENLTGKVTSPQTIANYICSDTNGSLKYRQGMNGTYNGFLWDQKTQDHFGITVEALERSISLEQVKAILKSGKMIILSENNPSGFFATRSGHYIVLAAVNEDNQVIVLDPARESQSRAHTDEVIQQQLLNHINSGIWSIASKNGYQTGDQCYTGASGDFMEWSQYDPQWRYIEIGGSGSNIGDIGCAITSVTILLKASGTQVAVKDLNPGTVVEYLNKHGGFNSGGGLNWYAPQSSGLAPYFEISGGRRYLTGSRSNKIQTLRSALNEGCYIVLKVREAAGPHWVALKGITEDGNNLEISDPGYDIDLLAWDTGRYYPADTTQFFCYKRTD